MRVDTRPRHKNAGRPPEKSCRGFLQWIRGRKCAADGFGLCDGRIVAAHVDHAGDKGMGTKASDRFAIPLCDGHHKRQHNKGWHTFERECLGGKSAVAMSDAYWFDWLRTPMGRNWQAKQDG